MAWSGTYKPVVFAILLFTFAINCFAQKTDTLHEFKVRAAKARHISADARLDVFAPGQKIITIDSAVLQQYQYQSIASLLAQQAPVFIKSYGFNSLATLNFRGASAAQSSVFWNGVPIQNAALGVTDVSLLPVSLMDKVNIVYGGSSALWGSGNVGGALMLENDMPVFDSLHTALSVSAGAGSFTQYMGALKAAYNNRRWFFSLNAYGQSAKDNFSYTDLSGSTKKMVNDAMYGGGAIAEAAYRFADKNVISLTAWYQYNNRDIPPALFETDSLKNSVNSSLRTVLQWNKETTGNKWYLKSSFIADNMVYDDPAILLHANNSTYQYYQEAGWQHKLDDHNQFLIFLPTQITWMKMVPDTLTRSIFKTAIAGAYNVKAFHNRLNAAVNVRAEIVNSTSFLLPGLDASYKVAEWLSLRGNVQRTYRTPTLDELYYVPGGNTTLKPEQGWNEDAGYSIKVKKGAFVFHHDLSVFNRNIKDWIVWFGGAIWTPHNIAQVHSRGVETQNEFLYTVGQVIFHISLNTSYIVATTTNSYIPNDGSIGKQIPYTPIYNGQANVGLSFKGLSFSYNHTYTGYRYITTDESEYLSPYQTGNIQAMYNIVCSRPILLLMQCNNVWNNRYAVVSARPMPGINYIIGVKFTILQ
ncbi:MAG: TonB-dependent receptor [Flavipsychrobacter sp.]|nr:TonB-dependent receptor [Flavipsychrobacter sp.]